MSRHALVNRTRSRPAIPLLLLTLAAALLALGVACSTPAATPTPTTAPAASPTSTPTPGTVVPTPTPTPTTAPTATRAPGGTPTAAATVVPTPTRAVATPTPTAAQAPTPTVSGKQPKRGGVLLEGTGADLPSYDVQTNISALHVEVLGKMYNTLLANPGGTVIECDVCETYELKENGKVLSFRLRKGIKFHSGAEMTSADVEFSVAKFMGLVDGVSSGRVGLLREYMDLTKGGGDGILTPDPYTVELHLTRPSGFALKLLASSFAGIMPKGTTAAQLKQGPQGSGPFLFDKYISGSEYGVVRNPNYFKQGLPYLDGIRIVIIRDLTASLTALLTGKTEFQIRSNGIPLSWAPQFDQREKAGTMTRLRYNSYSTPQGLFLNTSRAPFNNLKVRQAANLAIDRTQYIQIVHEGKAVAALTLSPGPDTGRTVDDIWDKVPGFGRGAKKDQEIEQGKQLLKEVYPNGVDIQIVFRDGDQELQMNEMFGAQLKKVGFNVTRLSQIDRNVLFPMMDKLDYTASGLWVTQSMGDPDEVWSGSFVTGAARNWVGYSNPDIDRMFIEQSSATDAAKRQEINRQMEDIMVRDLPYIPTASHFGEYIFPSYVKGIAIGFSRYTTGNARKEGVWLDR